MALKSQPRCLTRHFFDRFFDKDSIAPGSDPAASVIQVLSLLAVPGLMLSFWMRFSPYFYVSYSMVVMGFVTVLKWELLFPDRLDYLVLGSLPIRFRDLFASKVKALFLFVALFAVSANFFATIMVAVIGGGRIVFVAAHAGAVFGGALFMVTGFAALQGLLITILPNRLFRRVSPVVQMTSIALLLTIFLLYPLLQAAFAPLAERSSVLLDYFPIYWFLGLYMFLLLGGDADPVFAELAIRASYGLAGITALFIVTYTVAYKSHTRSVLDVMEAPPRNGARLWLSRALDRTLLLHPVQRGCFRFVGEILARSSKHQIFLAVYFAVGLSLGLTSLLRLNAEAAFPFEITNDGMLAFPLTLVFFLLSGLRATFNIPNELPANWIFRTTEVHDPIHYLAATRKWVALCGLLPMGLLVAVLELAYWPWPDAVLHLLFEAAVASILLQILFFNFRKVPFTCSSYPGKKNLAILAAVYLYGFTTYSSSMVALENWLVRSPARFVMFVMAAIAAIIVMATASRRRRAPLVYEEESGTRLLGLGLDGD